MNKLKYLGLATFFAAIVVGCTPTEEPKTDPETPAKTTETTSVETPDAKPDSATAEPAPTTSAPDRKSETTAATKPAVGKPDAARPATKEEAATAASKNDVADSKASSEKEADMAKVEAQNAKPLTAKPVDPAKRGNVNATPAAKPVQKDPPNVNKAAQKADFVGKWKRFMDAENRAKHAKFAAMLKKRGKPVFPTDNYITVNADGTFTWDDNATATGRKVTGTWTVASGKAMFTVKTVNGKAPDKDDSKSFDASVAKGAKTLFRQNSERGRYDRV